MTPLMIGFPGTTELLIVCGIIFLLFGASFFPKFMRGMGEGVREFRNIGKEMDDAVSDLKKETTTKENA